MPVSYKRVILKLSGEALGVDGKGRTLRLCGICITVLLQKNSVLRADTWAPHSYGTAPS